MTQAGVQSILVTVLSPNPGQAVNRWLDAAIGCALAPRWHRESRWCAPSPCDFSAVARSRRQIGGKADKLGTQTRCVRQPHPPRSPVPARRAAAAET
jgi:hypothetical protein